MSHYRGQMDVWDVVNEAVSDKNNSLRAEIKNSPNPEKLAANIKRLNGLGLEVQITETDRKISDGNGTLTQGLAPQSDLYRNMMQVCLTAQNCKRFSLWGVNDGYSWLPQFFKKPNAPLVFDELSRPKPTYDALMEVLGKSELCS